MFLMLDLSKLELPKMFFDERDVAERKKEEKKGVGWRQRAEVTTA